MGLLDQLNLGGVLGQLEASALPARLNTVLAKTQYGDLNGLVTKLQQSGLGPQVQSWLGNGANTPITADQLKAVLGNTQVQEKRPGPLQHQGAGKGRNTEEPGGLAHSACVS